MDKDRNTYSDDENPACFGKQPGALERCAGCRFLAGCRWYSDNPPPKHPYGRDDGRRHHATLDEYEGIGTPMELPEEEEGEDDSRDRPVFSINDMERLIRFLLFEVDDYSLSTALVMLRGGHQSIAETARVFGVGREAMRRKLEDSCRKYPAFARMLQGTITRCSRLSDLDALATVKGRRDAKKAASMKGGQMEINFTAQKGEQI